MVLRVLQNTRLVTATVLVASTVVLAGQILNPPRIVVAASGAGADVTAVGSYFTYREIGVVAVAACLCGASAAVLLLQHRSSSAPDPGQSRALTDGRSTLQRSDDLLEARRREWEETTDELADTERVIYETVLDADGVRAQREIVEETDLSKATVSRTLDTLESKGLVERKRRGTGNVVMLL
ncbi:helix-turn-helix transcriptional regulator [Natrinema longum]|uniref:MarR family transcriptional regulator n=1 Tax=Natrinema longum TaxID=370324 RepID=A0A8A2U9H2_9EURY|nr:MarR family transcriptional regulator [Natrinema longum]MBZ6493378.1 MarR family transcriptional regulator [Natrinema longum]QSW85274.1 MarR family transcriptional regulator [Natrinema longum]